MNTYDLGKHNSAIINYYQIGPATHRTKSLIELLLQISGDRRLYDELNEKVSDCDFSWELNDDYGILGYSIMVSTTEDNISAICVEELRTELVALIENLSDEEFHNLILGRMVNTDPDSGVLKDEVDRHWPEILNEKYVFDRHHRENEVLATLNRSDLLEFCRAHSGANERKLSILFIGCG